MLDKIIKIAILSCLAFLVAAPQILAEKKALFSSGFGVLILAGASIIAYWKISDFVKNRSAQNNS